jgi:adenylate kinase family enzyme
VASRPRGVEPAGTRERGAHLAIMRSDGGGTGPRRVSVVGNTGSGKSTVAREVARRLGVPHVELDAIRHQPGWEQMPDDRFLAAADRVTGGPGWVVDGNYVSVVMLGPVWARADTVVWLDLPRRDVMRQLVRRTMRRVLTRQELWNGNREPFSNLWSLDPERSVMAWAWTRHRVYRERYGQAIGDPRWAHLRFVRLRSHAEALAWVAALPRR